MEDKRKYKRHKINDLEINVKMALADEVIINNLSMGGASLKADRRLNIGKEYLLQLETKEIDIRIKGVVVWSLLTESKADHKGNIIPIFTAGLKFIDDSQEKIKGLIDLLEEHEKSQYRTDVDPQLGEFVNLSEEFKEVFELFAN